jgi:hypothetical protein
MNDSFVFIESKDGWEIAEYKGVEKDVVIPAVFDGQPVVSIGEYAFANKFLKSVVIPDGIFLIKEKAFYSNNLERVTFPVSIGNIGNHAFAVNQLTGIDLLYDDLHFGVIAIMEGAFYANKIKNVTLPDRIVNIGAGAFYYNPIIEIIIGKDVIIGENAFDKSFTDLYEENGRQAGTYSNKWLIS